MAQGNGNGNGNRNGNGRNGRIVVINPNSTEAVTDGIDAAMAPFRFSDGPEFDCVTIADGPPGIATQRHVDEAVAPICDLIGRENNAADAFVIACFSDPGLYSAREISAKPVFGIGAASYAQALLLGDRFGVIAILQGSVRRQRLAVRAMGLDSRYAGSLAIGLGAEELEGDGVRDRMIEVGRELVEARRADVLIMGCAGMARYRADVEAALNVPVVEPSQAAAAQALAAVRLARH